MARLVWSDFSLEGLEVGVSSGVLYVNNGPGIAWNGLISVTKKNSGGIGEPIYVDGVKVLSLKEYEDFEATMISYTYPEEFEVCDGTVVVSPGVIVTGQDRARFSFCYKSLVDDGYKLHLIYDVNAISSEISYSGVNKLHEALNFEWTLVSIPSDVPGYKPTTTIVIDSRKVDPRILSTIENILYGTDHTSPRIPTPSQIIYIIKDVEDLWLTDLGGGLWKAEGNQVTLLPDNQFEITYPTATDDGEIYTVIRD